MIFTCSDQIKFLPGIFLKRHLSEMGQHTRVAGPSLPERDGAKSESEVTVVVVGGVCEENSPATPNSMFERAVIPVCPRFWNLWDSNLDGGI